MILLRYTLREASRRPARMLLTLTGIVIGVAALVSVWVTAESTRAASRLMFRDLGGAASVEVVSNGRAGIDPGLAKRIRACRGVAAAVPIVRRTALLLTQKGRSPIAVLGIEPGPDRAARPLRLASGKGLAERPGVLLETEFARGLGLHLGATATIFTQGGRFELPVTGLLRPSGAAAWNGGAVAFVRLAKAQEMFALGDRVTAIQIVPEEGADKDRVDAEVTRVLPPGLTVEDTAARAAVSDSTLRSTDRGLASVSVMSLVAGAFIILNTFLMSLSERRRSLAILRSIGVTRGQLVRLLLGEALLLGTIGAALGIGFGLLAAVGMKAGMERLLGLTLPGLVLPALPLLLAAVLGPGMALAATIVPARRAAHRPVLAGLHPESAEGEERWPLLVPIAGVSLLVLSIVASVAFHAGTLPAVFVAPATAMMMVGCVLAAPIVLRPLLAGMGKLVGNRAGIAKRLAFAHLDRHRVRTALTTAVLSLAVIVAIGMGNSIRNNLREFSDWFHHAVPGDFFVRFAMPDTATMTAPALPPEVLGAVRAMPGVDYAVPVKFLSVRAGKWPAILIARSFPKNRPASIVFRAGRPRQVMKVLRQGGVAIGTLLAQRLSVGPGDEIPLATAQGEKRMKVGGVVTEYTAGGAALYMTYSTAKRLFGIGAPDIVVLDAAPGAKQKLGRELSSYCRRHGLLLQTNEVLEREIDRMIDGIAGLLWALLLLVFVVASLGVVNTLTMNVLEQTREIGILRAVAMTKGQVSRYVRSQGVLLAVAGIPPGVAAGMVVAYGMHYVSGTLLGFDVMFRLDPWVVIVSVALSIATAFLASLLPARHAARIRVSQAVTWE